jgi:hypothetical protein
VAHGVPFLRFRVFLRLVRLDHARARRLGRRLSALDRRRARYEAGARRSAESLLGWVTQANARRFVAAVVARLAERV